MDKYDKTLEELEGLSQMGMDDFLADGDEQSLSAQLDERISNRTADLQPKGRVRYMRLIRVAAGILLLAAAGFLLMTRWGGSQGERLYADNFTAFEDVISTNLERGNQDASQVFDDLMVLYNQRRYDEFLSAPYFSQFKVVTNPLMGIYRANALMEVGRFEEAISSLQKVRSVDSPERYLDVTQWYLALAYLHQGDHDAASSLFAKIASTKEHFKRDEATSLLKKLKVEE